MKARKTDYTWRYVLERDRDEKPEDKTVFTLKALTDDQRTEIKNIRYAQGFGDADRATLIAGIAGWKNLKNADTGAEIKFRTEEIEGQNLCHVKNLEYLWEADKLELIRAINMQAEMSEEDLKNLPS